MAGSQPERRPKAFGHRVAVGGIDRQIRAGEGVLFARPERLRGDDDVTDDRGTRNAD